MARRHGGPVCSRVVEIDVAIKQAVYGWFAETGRRPTTDDVSARADAPVAEVLASYARLRAQRLLVLEPDGASIRMAPPFSGVPTQHVVESGGMRYFANCAWDAFGIVAALHRPGTVLSRCEQSLEPLRLELGADGPPPSDWLFHTLVPAARWWSDIVFT